MIIKKEDFFNDGRLKSKIYFLNGKKHGASIYYLDKPYVKFTEFVYNNNELNGVTIHYYIHRALYTYKNNMKHGISVEFKFSI